MVITLYIAGGLFLLLLGGEGLVRGAVALARNLGISTVIIGLTVVAFGTSAPELAVSFQGALSGHPDITMGNIIGSNISNILLVLGITALIYPIAIDKRLIQFDAPVMAKVTLIFILFCLFGTIGSVEGIILLFFMVIYFWILIKQAQDNKTLPEHQTEEVEELIKVDLNSFQALVFIVVGAGFLVVGSDFLVEGAVRLARTFEIPESTISVTLIAIGSSAPELFASAVAARHQHSDIAIGNVIGSNLLNIFGGLGLVAIFSPLPVDQSFLKFDIWVLLVVTLLLLFLIKKTPNISTRNGGLFTLGYIAYICAQFFKM